MNLHRLDLFSRSLFSLIARTGSISRGAELAAQPERVKAALAPPRGA